MRTGILRHVIRPIIAGSGFLVWGLLAVGLCVSRDIVNLGEDAAAKGFLFLSILVVFFLRGRRVIRLGCTPERRESLFVPSRTAS